MVAAYGLLGLSLVSRLQYGFEYPDACCGTHIILLDHDNHNSDCDINNDDYVNAHYHHPHSDFGKVLSKSISVKYIDYSVMPKRQDGCV